MLPSPIPPECRPVQHSQPNGPQTGAGRGHPTRDMRYIGTPLPSFSKRPLPRLSSWIIGWPRFPHPSPAATSAVLGCLRVVTDSPQAQRHRWPNIVHFDCYNHVSHSNNVGLKWCSMACGGTGISWCGILSFRDAARPQPKLNFFILTLDLR